MTEVQKNLSSIWDCKVDIVRNEEGMFLFKKENNSKLYDAIYM
jgi:hypothetical protein